MCGTGHVATCDGWAEIGSAGLSPGVDVDLL